MSTLVTNAFVTIFPAKQRALALLQQVLTPRTDIIAVPDIISGKDRHESIYAPKSFYIASSQWSRMLLEAPSRWTERELEGRRGKCLGTTSSATSVS
jgi:hypothetical protein